MAAFRSGSSGRPMVSDRRSKRPAAAAQIDVFESISSSAHFRLLLSFISLAHAAETKAEWPAQAQAKAGGLDPETWMDRCSITRSNKSSVPAAASSGYPQMPTRDLIRGPLNAANMRCTLAAAVNLTAIATKAAHAPADGHNAARMNE